MAAMNIDLTGLELRRTDQVILHALERLFWLVTAVPGVARYADDVEFFAGIAMLLDPSKKEYCERLIEGYRKSEENAK